MTEPEAPPRPQYSLQTRLREETEAPFRKARMFVYAGSAASAGVGAFIAGLRVIAALAGVSGVQPLAETIPNIAIDLGVVGACALLLRFEKKAGEKRLERMSRGARLASLRAKEGRDGKVKRLSEWRGQSRVIIVAGNADKVRETMEGAAVVSAELVRYNLVVVPLVVDGDTADAGDALDGNSSIIMPYVAKPYARDEWLKWYELEKDVVKTNLRAKEVDLFVLIVRLDGKVGARSVGVPMFKRLIEEVSKLPKADQYGRP